MYLRKKKSRWRGLIISTVLFLLLAGVFTGLLSGTGDTADREQVTVLETAIRSAAVSAYATEGRYPDTLERVVRDYGIIIDEERFHVDYSIFAENIMPDISVTFKGESES